MREKVLLIERKNNTIPIWSSSYFIVANFFQKNVPGFEKVYIVRMATALGIRTSRGIEGEITLTSEDTSSNKSLYLDDTIGCQPARARFQETGEFFHAHTFDIPYRIMVPKKVENLLVGSGKSVSCQPQGIIRSMCGCMTLGQASDTAAALAAKLGETPRQLNVRELQKKLSSNGVYLGDDERLKELELLS